MESQDLVSVSRIVSRPKGFRSCLGLDGYRSRSQAYCFKTL